MLSSTQTEPEEEEPEEELCEDMAKCSLSEPAEAEEFEAEAEEAEVEAEAEEAEVEAEAEEVVQESVEEEVVQESVEEEVVQEEEPSEADKIKARIAELQAFVKGSRGMPVKEQAKILKEIINLRTQLKKMS
jgi:hypothetical protein